MTDYVGEMIGNYRLERCLGKGGFAEVYLATHVHLDTQAAIKILHTQLGDEAIEQFRREARTIARLDHPHIIRVIDFGVTDNTPYLIMTYAPNGTLRQRHAKGSRVPLSTIVYYVDQIASALAYAHQHRVIHRDIKPENLLLSANNTILISDFGIAMITQSTRNPSMLDAAGTIAYMAPEQIEARPCAASDQYALGIIVYEWITGTRPFTGSFTEVAAKHTITPPPPIREKVPNVPPAVEEAVMIALAKDVNSRFASIDAFAYALKQAAQEAIESENGIIDQPTQSLAKVEVAPSDALTIGDRTVLASDSEVRLTTTGFSHSKNRNNEIFAGANDEKSSQNKLNSWKQTEEGHNKVVPVAKKVFSWSVFFPPRRKQPKTWIMPGVLLLLLLLGGSFFWLLPLLPDKTTPKTTKQVASINSADPGNTHTVADEHILSATNVANLQTSTAINLNYTNDITLLANNTLYIHIYNQHTVKALDPGTGKMRWSTSIPENAVRLTVVQNKLLCSGASTLTAVDTQSGKKLWTSYLLGVQVIPADKDQVSPDTTHVVVVNNIVYVASAVYRHLYAFDIQSGKRNWSVVVKTTGNDAISDPSVDSKAVYLVTPGHLIAYNVHNGRVLWNIPIQNGSYVFNPTVASNRVYVTANGALWAFNTSDGALLWSNTSSNFTGEVALINNKVVVNASQLDATQRYIYDMLEAFDARTGQMLWTSKALPHTGTSFTLDNLKVANGVIYGHSYDTTSAATSTTVNRNSIFAIDLSNGNILWSYKPASGVVYMLSPSSGTLYILNTPPAVATPDSIKVNRIVAFANP